MKFYIKKLIAIASLTGAMLFSASALTISTNTTVTGIYHLLDGPAKVSSVQILAGVNALTVNLFDTGGAYTNYTNSAYTTTQSYMSNIQYSYISPLNGTTNIQTNYYLYTGALAVAANTNNPYPYLSFPCQASVLATYPVNYLASRGLTISTTTNCTVVITYRIND
jgi:hypothetical protein